MPDSMFMRRVRSKLQPGTTEGGDGDVDREGLPRTVGERRPGSEDYRGGTVAPADPPAPMKR